MTDFDLRFKHWIRWCRRKGFHRGQVGSAEGEYSGHDWDAPEPRGEVFNELDANLFNRAYSQIAQRSRRVIKVLYFRERWRPQWQAQKLGCSVVEIPRIGHEAKSVLMVRVDFLERRAENTRTVPAVLSLQGRVSA